VTAVDALRTACACCRGVTLLTAAEVANRPGLSAIAYRVGTHGRFKASLLAGISAQPQLRALTTRDDGDWTIALLDAWAVVLDVLSFYQERIANEGFLRTAAERLSLLELARAIGYELGPGVAASTHLAFTLDGNPQSPPEVVIPVRTRAQSVPAGEELPQSFETVEEIVARPEWNAMRPRQAEPQLVAAPIRRLVLHGTDTRLQRGDRLLAVDGSQREAFRVVRVEVENPPPGSTDPGRTEVELLPADPNAPALSPGYLGVPAFLPPDPPGPLPFTAANVQTYVLGNPSWPAGELAARLERLGWSAGQLATYLAAVPRPGPTTALAIYALRVKASLFGHNAPKWGTLPAAWRTETGAPYPTSWDGTLDIDANENSQGVLHDPNGRVIYLDQAQPAVLPAGWLVLEEAGSNITRAYQVDEAREESRADFGISGKATRLVLDTDDDLFHFEFRNTTAYAASEQLALAEVPNEQEVSGSAIELDGFALGLAPGRTVVVRGERADLAGVVEAEVRQLAEVVHWMERGTTRLVLAASLAHAYRRDTLTVAANVVAATHGETRREVLGGGDAAERFQEFALKHKHLTYVAAPVPSGGKSTLEVRVNDVLWHEAPDLFFLGPGERRYVLRRDDDGTTRVLFGDGARGARLPTGRENVTALYRNGVGLAGHLDAGRITLLAGQPLGVREVVNPLPARGGEDPDTLDQARRNAPLTVLTLDRVVSLADFEHFARAFSGIAKARADWLWDGRRRVVLLTVAAADGGAPDEQLLTTLTDALDGLRDPFQTLVVAPLEPLLFRVEARVKVHPDHLQEDVFTRVEAALVAGFSFAARELGRSLARSAVVAAIQKVEGVVALDLELLDYDPPGGGPPPAEGRLLALPARLGPPAVDGRRPALGAQLLTLAAQGVSLEAMP
jgi:predicted phage baseplate assembly protein